MKHITIQITPRSRDRLALLKRRWHLSSYDEVIKHLTKIDKEDEIYECPYCFRDIESDTVRCPFCAKLIQWD